MYVSKEELYPLPSESEILRKTGTEEDMNYSSKGFTLVEVALSVAVGLIIIGGAVLMYNAAQDIVRHKTGNSYIITVPHGQSYSTYYTSSFTEKDNCIEFKDTWGNTQKVCGSYQVQGP